MTFSIATNPQGDSRIDELSRRQTRSIKQTGLLGVMQDRTYISAYRSRALKMEPPRSRARAYVSYSQAYRNDDRKNAAIRHLRLSQSSCFLVRCFRTLQTHVAWAAQTFAKQRESAASVSG